MIPPLMMLLTYLGTKNSVDQGPLHGCVEKTFGKVY